MINQELLPESAVDLFEQLQRGMQGLPVDAVAGVVEALMITAELMSDQDLQTAVATASETFETVTDAVPLIVRQLRS